MRAKRLALVGIILALLVKADLTKTRSEARRAVLQGGVTAGDEKVSDIKQSWAPEEIPADGLVLRRGKKAYKRVTLK